MQAIVPLHCSTGEVDHASLSLWKVTVTVADEQMFLIHSACERHNF